MRELEALIRLSESIARVHLDSEVHRTSTFSDISRYYNISCNDFLGLLECYQVWSAHVHMAARIIITSIIRFPFCKRSLFYLCFSLMQYFVKL